MVINWADWTIVGILAISSLISIRRGFVKEAISLLVWGMALFVSMAFHGHMAVLMQAVVESASLRYLLSFVVLFVATFVVGSMVKYLVGELVRMTGLSGTDRLFGMAFGLARGMIVVMAVLILVPMAFPVNQYSWWQQSTLIPQFLLIEYWCKDTFALLLDLFGRLMP